MMWGWGIVSLTLASVPTTIVSPQNGFNSMVSPNKYPLNCIIMAYLVNQSRSASKIKPPQLRRGFMTVPRVGLEPTLPEGNWILNPARLPISPPRQ